MGFEILLQMISMIILMITAAAGGGPGITGIESVNRTGFIWEGIESATAVEIRAFRVKSRVWTDIGMTCVI